MATPLPASTPEKGPSTTDPTPDPLPAVELDTVYARKAHALNTAIQSIGMGRYQHHLFILAGFGWFVDNLWPQVTALILPAIVTEFRTDGAYLVLAQNVGLMLGAAGWGLASDVVGRRWAFSLTLVLAGVFGVAAGGVRNFVGLAAMAGCWSVGVGGNLPVDSAVFLEFLPGSHQYLLTVMSVWWGFGQIVASAVAWPLMANFACPTDSATCTKDHNMGWRYLVFTMGGLTLLLFALRFFVFTLHESPKFLMGRGHDSAAVDILHKVAHYNRKPCAFTISDLRDLEDPSARSYTTTRAAVSRTLTRFRATHIRALFHTPATAHSTTLLLLLWFLIGLCFPLYNAFLPYLLATRFPAAASLAITYRNYLLLGVLSLPGSLLGALIAQQRCGRRGALALATAATGVFLLASTSARSQGALLGWNCAYALTSSMMYGVLYGYTPEVFATKDRGTGNGLVATANRVGGVVAPVVAKWAGTGSVVPVWVAGGGFLVAAAVVAALPFESRGRASL